MSELTYFHDFSAEEAQADRADAQFKREVAAALDAHGAPPKVAGDPVWHLRVAGKAGRLLYFEALAWDAPKAWRDLDSIEQAPVRTASWRPGFVLVQPADLNRPEKGFFWSADLFPTREGHARGSQVVVHTSAYGACFTLDAAIADATDAVRNGRFANGRTRGGIGVLAIRTLAERPEGY